MPRRCCAISERTRSTGWASRPSRRVIHTGRLTGTGKGGIAHVDPGLRQYIADRRYVEITDFAEDQIGIGNEQRRRDHARDVIAHMTAGGYQRGLGRAAADASGLA